MTLPIQKIPARGLASSDGLPGGLASAISVPTARNFASGATTRAPQSSEVCAALVGMDSSTLDVAGKVLAGEFGGDFSMKVTFKNIPSTQSSTQQNAALPVVQTVPFTAPPGVLATFFVFATWSTSPSDSILPTPLVVTQDLKDSTGAGYNGHILTPGATYLQFGAQVSGRFYNPTKDDITLSGTLDVYGVLIATYPSSTSS